jgi:alpha-ketoglutarate-dependent taurine dioxygenase
VINEVNQFLNSELLSALAGIGLKPSYFVYFGLMDRLSYVTPIHIDVSPVAENAKVSFAVNWELTATRSQWQWWDAGNATEIAPSAEDTEISEKKLLSGARYNDSREFQLIESYDLEPSTAYLVRADLPHCISYTNPTPERICISVRFDLATKITWSEAVALFEPLIIRQHQ